MSVCPIIAGWNWLVGWLIPVVDILELVGWLACLLDCLLEFDGWVVGLPLVGLPVVRLLLLVILVGCCFSFGGLVAFHLPICSWLSLELAAFSCMLACKVAWLVGLQMIGSRMVRLLLPMLGTGWIATGAPD